MTHAKDNNEKAKPSSDTPKVYDLDKVDTPDYVLDVVNKAKNDAAEQITGVRLSPGFQDAIQSMTSIGDRVSKMLSDFPKIPIPSPPTYETVDIVIPENPAYETNRLLREQNAKLDRLYAQNAQLVAPNFDQVNSEIIFANKRIAIPKNTDQAELVRSLFSEKSNPNKVWDWSEMLEDWGTTDYRSDGWRKVYMCALEVKKKIAIETGVKDLLVITTKTTALNPRYFAESV